MKKATKKEVSSAPRTRNTYVTPEQFLKLPLSQAILQVIEDVKLMKSEKIRINMSLWWQTGDDNKKPCTVCLGGAALCSFAPDKVNGYDINVFGRKVLGIGEGKVRRIVTTFDQLRRGNPEEAARNWYGQNRQFSQNMRGVLDYDPLASEYLTGHIDTATMNRFLKVLEEFAYRLQEVGY